MGVRLLHASDEENQCYYGMKAHVGVDDGSGYIHSLTGTAANAHDISEAHNLIRGEDEVVYGDSENKGVEKREQIKEDEHLSQIEYRINRKPSELKVKKDYISIN